jgi:hypothetical protein
VEDWAEVRRLHRSDGMGIRAIARHTNYFSAFNAHSWEQWITVVRSAIRRQAILTERHRQIDPDRPLHRYQRAIPNLCLSEHSSIVDFCGSVLEEGGDVLIAEYPKEALRARRTV